MSDASPKSYPRGLPYKPPEEMAAREARLRRWTVWLVLVALIVVAWMVGSGIYVMRKLSRLPESFVQADGKAAGGVPHNDKPPANPVARPRPEEKEPDKAEGTEPAKAAEPANDREIFLDALGMMTGVHLYQCYLNIGLLADGAEGDVYTVEQAQKWLERTLAHMNQVDKQLEKIGQTALDAEEKKRLERCRQVSALLSNQARELKDYWKNSEKEHADKYHKAREEAWAGISDVLQIPKEP